MRSKSGEDALLPGVEGLKGPFGCLNRARYGISWGVMGRGRSMLARRAAIWAGSQAIPAPLGRNANCSKKSSQTLMTEISLGLQSSLRVGRLMDESRAAPEMISLVKRNNSGKALEIARAARRHAWRQRHSRGFPGDAPHDEPRDREHIRGHA